MNDIATDKGHSSLHERSANLSSGFHNLQREILAQANTEQGEKLQ